MSALNLDLGDCDYNKVRKTLSLGVSGGRFPVEVSVHSHHTNRTIRFVRVQPGHPAWDEDGWDGEQQVYAPVAALPNVETLTLYHTE